jgi:hypothetical protein
MIAISVDSYIFDVLMADLVGHDHKPSAYLTYLAILAAGQGKAVALSHGELAERTGLSKRAVQYAVMHLKRRRLLASVSEGRTETPRYLPLTPWRDR